METGDSQREREREREKDEGGWNSGNKRGKKKI